MTLDGAGIPPWDTAEGKSTRASWTTHAMQKAAERETKAFHGRVCHCLVNMIQVDISLMDSPATYS